MENSSNDSFIKNIVSKKNLDNNNNFSVIISKSLIYIFFIKLCLFLYLFIFLIREERRQKKGIKEIISLLKTFENRKEKKKENFIYLDKFETHIYNRIKKKLIDFPCHGMWKNQREFLNGVVRRFRPKKIVEIGVREGCASSVILNAIKDMNNSHLYSIDLNRSPSVGKCVYKSFHNLLSKWTLYKGDIAVKFMEKIGKNIDMAFIDSAHLEPGEILDFIIILPFLSEEAVIVMHDIANQITAPSEYKGWLGKRNEWAPYLMFNSMRGKIYLPSGNNLLTHDIGARKLDFNQRQYFHDYFRVLGGQWQYFPKEKYIQEMRIYFKKYYDKNCLNIFNEAVNFNRKFVKQNPKENIYRDN